MRKVSWFMCLLATIALGFAGAASAQQQSIDSGSPLDQSRLQGTQIEQPGDAAELPPHQLNHPSEPQSPDRSLLRANTSQAAPVADGSQIEKKAEAPRGELGVWLAGLNGPGLAIRRVTAGSAAEQAGVRTGDVLMQVNDRWATSPQQAAEMIRAIPVGETVKLQIWREGQVQDLSAAIAAPRPQAVAMTPMNSTQTMNRDDDVYQAGFRGDDAPANSELSQRVIRLERQLGTMTQELQQLREQITKARNISAAPSGNEASITIPQQPLSPSAPASPASPATEQPSAEPAPPATEQPSAETDQPKADEAPATETPAADDSLFK